MLCRNDIRTHGLLTFVSAPVVTKDQMFSLKNPGIGIGANISSTLSNCLLLCAHEETCRSFNFISNRTCQLLTVDIFGNKSLMTKENSCDHINLPVSKMFLTMSYIFFVIATSLRRLNNFMTSSSFLPLLRVEIAKTSSINCSTHAPAHRARTMGSVSQITKTIHIAACVNKDTMESFVRTQVDF